jgi:hypothetical protein
MYVQGQNIWNPNNLNVSGSKKPKGPKQGILNMWRLHIPEGDWPK